MTLPDLRFPLGVFPFDGLRTAIKGISRQRVGKGWSSGGRAEADVFHYLHFALAGRARIRHRGVAFSLTAGRAYWLWGDAPVVREPAEDYDHVSVRFRLESVHGTDPLIEATGPSGPKGRPLDLGPFDFAAWFEPLRASPARLHLALESLVLGWAARHVEDLDELLATHRVRWSRFPGFFAAVEARLGADLRIGDLAAAEGRRTNAFSNVFRRHFGMSPKEHLNRRLFREACILLATGDAKIREIARILRFTDEAYFNRFFRKRAGMSPGEYRRIRS